jgi:hypothetical protein
MQHSALTHGGAAGILQGCAGVVCGTEGTRVTPAPSAVSHCESAELLLPVLRKIKEFYYSSTTEPLI